tara:strand:- start:461 stop:853 length:393 start_codon:yes stop_codon:yes gene_type:complete
MGKEYGLSTSTEVLLYNIWKGLNGTGGGLPVAPVSPSNPFIGDGRTVVAAPGTAVPLAAGTTCKTVTVQAEKDNTGDIIVGGSGVVGPLLTRTGSYLSPGDSIDLPINDLNSVYIDAMVAGDGVTYIYFN